MKRTLLFALALLPLVPPATAQDDDFYADPALARLLQVGREDNRADEHLRYLTERIGPRLTSSTNLQRACEWARAQFAGLGLDARLERWGEFPVGFDRHPWSGGMVAPERIDFAFVTHAWTPGTPGPVRGPARPYPLSLDEVEAAPASYAGAWIVRRTRKDMPELADRRAIEARLVELGIAGEVRNGGAELLVTAGNHRVDPDDLPRLVSVRVLEEHYVDLLDRLEAGEPVELEFDVDNRFLRGPVPLYNVIADLRGSELPDEYVLIGGHLDSWDGARGAQDNGTGVATTMEAARLLVAAGARPKRTIRFVLWTGEEQGLLGSSAYVEAHPELLPKISAVLIHDGGTNYLSGIAGPPVVIDDLRKAFRPIMDLDPEKPFEVSEIPGLPRGGGSDHVPFVRAGVPGFFWRQSGETSYRFVHHTQHDVLAHCRPDYQRHSALVAAVGAYNLARLDGLLDRTNLVEAEPRRMGVFLRDNEVTGLTAGGKAEGAGWQQGDRILSIDGVEVESRSAIVEEVQKGGARKLFRLRRGKEELESTIDWSDTPGELARQEGAAAEPRDPEPKAGSEEP
ncbi:MAG: M20/M25/M40 family metallo-hydrolase [Planctomycetota bacterium]